MAAAFADAAIPCLTAGEVDVIEASSGKWLQCSGGESTAGSASTVDDETATDGGLEVSSDDEVSSEESERPPAFVEVDVLSADLQLESIVDSCRWHGDWYFLVKWNGVEAPFWMLESELLDSPAWAQVAGFRRQQLVRPRKGKSGGCLQRLEKERVNRQLLKAARARWSALAASRYSSAAADLWPNFVKDIEAAFRAASCRVVRIENICDPARIGEFNEKSKMVFHGTSSLRLESIIDHGLRVPGYDGVAVVNGSAFGVGIYTATTPQIYYAKDFSPYMGSQFQMLCCAAQPNSEKNAGGYKIYFNKNSVLPCFLVTAERSAGGPPLQPKYIPHLESDLPIKVEKFQDDEDAEVVHMLPRQGHAFGDYTPSAATPQTTMTLPFKQRIPYVVRGDNQGDDEVRPTWFSRQRRSLTAAQVRALPRAVKQPWREGRVHRPRVDQTRQEKSRRVAAVRSSMSWKSMLVFSGP